MASNGYIGHMPWADRHEGSGESDLAKRFRVICGADKIGADSVDAREPEAGQVPGLLPQESKIVEMVRYGDEFDSAGGESMGVNGSSVGTGEGRPLQLSCNGLV